MISAQRACDAVSMLLLVLDPDLETFCVDVVFAKLTRGEALFFQLTITDWTVLTLIYLRKITVLIFLPIPIVI